MNKFPATLALQRSLVDAFRLLMPRRGETMLLLAELLTKLIVSLLLGLIFFVAHFVLNNLLRAVVSRARVPREVIAPIFTALRSRAAGRRLTPRASRSPFPTSQLFIEDAGGLAPYWRPERGS